MPKVTIMIEGDAGDLYNVLEPMARAFAVTPARAANEVLAYVKERHEEAEGKDAPAAAQEAPRPAQSVGKEASGKDAAEPRGAVSARVAQPVGDIVPGNRYRGVKTMRKLVVQLKEELKPVGPADDGNDVEHIIARCRVLRQLEACPLLDVIPEDALEDRVRAACDGAGI